MYTADTARDGGGDYDRAIDELHQRFREKEVEIFENHGAEIVAVWQNLDDPNTLIWMLAYRDRAHRQEVWEAFRADPEWTTLRAKYPVPVSADVHDECNRLLGAQIAGAWLATREAPKSSRPTGTVRGRLAALSRQESDVTRLCHGDHSANSNQVSHRLWR